MDALDWNLARAFCATAEAGSLSAAARRLGLTQPTLSRQVAALEAALGVTLFERVGKALALTEAGRALLGPAQAMAAAAEAMTLAAAGAAEGLLGRVSISASDVVAAHLLPDMVARIRGEAPGITVAIVVSNALSDLRRREADIAIRHARPTEPDLIGRLIGESAAHLYAAESWLAERGAPATPADLAPEDVLGFAPVERFAAHLSAAGVPVTPEGFRVVSENAVAILEMARRGLGVVMMMREVAERLPDLVRILPDLPGVPIPIWLVTHRELRTSRRVRVVYDLLGKALGDRVRG
jgi:DNA-binding transcriptional LysR family regulator